MTNATEQTNAIAQNIVTAIELSPKQRINLSTLPKDRILYIPVSVLNTTASGDTRKKTIEFQAVPNYNNSGKFSGVSVNVINKKGVENVFNLTPSKHYGFTFDLVERKFRKDAIEAVLTTLTALEFAFNAVNDFAFPLEFGLCAYLFSQSNTVQLADDELSVATATPASDELKANAIQWLSKSKPVEMRLKLKAQQENITSSGQEVLTINTTASTVEPEQLPTVTNPDTGVTVSVDVKDYSNFTRPEAQEYCTELGIEWTQRDTLAVLKTKLDAYFAPKEVTEQTANV